MKDNLMDKTILGATMSDPIRELAEKDNRILDLEIESAHLKDMLYDRDDDDALYYWFRHAIIAESECRNLKQDNKHLKEEIAKLHVRDLGF